MRLITLGLVFGLLVVATTVVVSSRPTGADEPAPKASATLPPIFTPRATLRGSKAGGSSFDCFVREVRGAWVLIHSRSEHVASGWICPSSWSAYSWTSVAPDAPTGLAGTVLAANMEKNVILISVGAEDGVRPGDQFVIARGGQYVATLQIENVLSKKSSGRLIEDMTKEAVRVGDRAVTGN